MIDYLGRFHPLFVHLPIGFIAFWILLEFLTLLKKENYDSVKKLLLWCSALSAILSSILGYLLSLKGEYSEDLLEQHKWAGIWLSLLLFILSIGYKYASHLRFFKLIYYISVLGVVLLITITGHQGGSLTHGEDFLSLSHLEPKKIATRKKITDINKAVVYQDIIQPIIDQKCLSCHNSGKKKGGLLMDTYPHLMVGGESGKIIISGNASQSELMKLANLDPNEKRAMPPKGKTPLTEDEKTVIAWWIDSGAEESKQVGALKPKEEMFKILTKLTMGTPAHSEGGDMEKLPEVAAASPDEIKEVQNLGVNVVTIAQNSHLIDVRSIINKDQWTDSKTEALLKLKNQIYILDLSNTAITNKSLLAIGKLTALQNLMLHDTKLTDENIVALKNLKNLQYLNIFNTQISDKAIETLSSLKSLKKIYVWQSKISPAGMEILKKKLPNVQVIGADELKTI